MITAAKSEMVVNHVTVALQDEKCHYQRNTIYYHYFVRI